MTPNLAPSQADSAAGLGGAALPESFFTVLLPRLESMAELKVTLYLRWILSRPGAPRAISLGRLEEDRLLLHTLKPVPGPRPAEETLREGLEMAVTRGSLLSIAAGDSPDPRLRWYLLNLPEHQDRLLKLGQGVITPAEVVGEDIRTIEVIKIYRPNIFSLYEQMIGVLTPTVADGLRDAESVYPADWLADAFRLAVEYNKRSWAYVHGILKRWETEGRTIGTDRGHSEAAVDSEKYTSGRYGRLVES